MTVCSKDKESPPVDSDICPPQGGGAVPDGTKGVEDVPLSAVEGTTVFSEREEWVEGKREGMVEGTGAGMLIRGGGGGGREGKGGGG